MIDLLSHLTLGFSAALTPINLLLCLAGALLGTLIGVLPGIGPLATVAMLLPVTFHLEPLGALIMLAGIFYGAQYGGSTTAILLRLPGEAASVVTCLDGHAMACQGRAGAALAIAALASLFAGCVTTLVIALAGPALAQAALAFGPADYTALMGFGLVAAVVLAHGSILRAAGMIALGLLLGLVGTDTNTGDPRLTVGLPALYDGIDFVALSMGLFGLAEIVANLEGREPSAMVTRRVQSLWPGREDFRRAWPAAVRGTMIGTLLGVLPGGGATISSFAAYTLEKRLARQPDSFGKGAVEGVAGPEAANNAGAQACFIPMLTLGIPPNAIMALMVGALAIHGITPGPQVIDAQPTLFWGLVASMWVGNLMLVIINLPMIGLWVRLLTVPYDLMFPSILLLCCLGVYSLSNSTFDVGLMAVFGLAGYLFRKLACEPAPFLLGFVLGPPLEENLRRTLLISRGDALVFLERPISLTLIFLSIALLAAVVVPAVRRGRETVLVEEG